ncbi:S-adenosyl-L-methionine dependent methyltransferase [Cytidiella melzeri]|nr:S-adenosyl-L-methionine dependent methyltransferase [Cytidiella melzeri]
MHPRNPYQAPPDFLALAENYPALKPHLVKAAVGYSIDFHDSNAQRCLTQALLHRDFSLKLSVPEDRLCPPVSNRLNYILWLQDVMTSSCPVGGETRTVTGVDIGTGASAIYPLLGCRTNQHWQFIATEIDVHSLECAQTNIFQNGLQGRIRMIQAVPGGRIFPPAIFDIHSHIDFTMCNPPFYGDKEEVLRSAEAKEIGPSAVCTGADTEMITPGGEVAFVGEMVAESTTLTTRSRWYSSMLGKLSSLTAIVQLLRDRQIDNYAIAEFVQGKTRRWAIAWSLTNERLPDSVARITNPTLQSMMPPRNSLKHPFGSVHSPGRLRNALHHVLANIEGVTFEQTLPENVTQDQGFPGILVHASSNTWSRAARRRKKLAVKSGLSPGRPIPTLSCRIQKTSTNDGDTAQMSLEFQWVRGADRGLFESFMSHVSRKVDAALKSSEDTMVL